MRYAGIDIGSRSIELVVTEGQEVIESRQTDSGFDPMAQAKTLLNGVEYDAIMSTGYGRHLFETAFNSDTVTEIRAYAVGVRTLFPQAHTILDIGGQDSKAIALNDEGRIKKFEMNDRCAAGTGKFLEIMARSLGYDLDEFGTEALGANKDIQISSMCTVFAESEVTSLVAKGEDRGEIALGLHNSVIRRAVGMLKRVSLNASVVFAGGVAKNPCMRHLLEKAIDQNILVPEDPQMVGALGAALLAAEAN
ncbi:acyl-CoA dehydratase activase [Desulfonema magnum]|uniref:CoA enzyme activase domain-containing protein n=1 Tax=Desulfonema magnum TaxID=45655 RepID=A0A975BH30_9BACT|nr:acyl-CoA dehydratase activase [Desulfonema magnum]QTA85089.1 CoA enzyme activase domain-containing protein [Desulfonema magnum]